MNWRPMLCGALAGGGIGFLIWGLPEALACACVLAGIAGDLAGYK